MNSRRRPPSWLVPLLPLLLLPAGCRDAPELLEPTELPPLGPTPYRLTYDPGRDVSPTWSADGEQVIYITDDLRIDSGVVVIAGPPVESVIVIDTLPTGGTIRAIPREGGISTRLLPNLQSASTSVPARFAAQSSDGRVAVLSRLALADRTLCIGAVSPCDTTVPRAVAPRLTGAVIRVREPGSTVPIDDDPQLEVEHAGRVFDTSESPGGLDGLWRVDRYPFQERFVATGRAPDRLSWAPDGDRLVYSDGLALRIWNPGTGASTVVPGAEDGVEPAWSPTGDWIAFERPVRGGLTEETCEHRIIPENPGDPPGAVVCVEQRRSWTVPSRSLAVIRPDGSDLRLLPDGARPAWGPDGQRVYYEGGGEIRSVRLDEPGVFSVVPNTQNGFEPAVSPDGRWLAFTRVDPNTLAADIWIVEIGQ